LDYLWAELPMVVTRGDYFGDLVDDKVLGKAVPAGDVKALSRALEKVLYDESTRDRAKKSIAAIRKDFYWPTVVKPLIAYIDSVAGGSAPVARGAGKPIRYSPQRPKPPRFRPQDVGLALQRLFRGEFSSLWRALVRRLRPSGR
jgi:hypothetical protein